MIIIKKKKKIEIDIIVLYVSPKLSTQNCNKQSKGIMKHFFYDQIVACEPFSPSCKGPPPVNSIVPDSSYESV